MASRGGPDSDILFQPGGDVEVSRVKGNVYLVYGSAAPRGPFVNVDEVGGSLYLLDTRHLDREMGADAVTRGALIRGMTSHQTSHALGCLKIATPTCEEIIIVHSSFSSCKIGRVVGDFVPVNGHLPAFLSIQRWEGRFFSGVSEGMLPNPSLLFVSKTLKGHMNRGRLSPYANDTLGQRPKALPARPPPLALPPTAAAPVAPVTPRQDEITTVKASHESSPYLSEGEIPPDSSDSQPPSRPAAPPSAPTVWVLPFTKGVKVPPTWTADPSKVICGNCRQRGHQVRECVGPVDCYGYISGCPVCNARKHHLETCPFMKGLNKPLKKMLSYQMLCVWRQNKPPIHSDQCWVTVCGYGNGHAPLALRPLPAYECIDKFFNQWEMSKYKACYGNPNLNGLILPLNATVTPKPGSEGWGVKVWQQKGAVKKVAQPAASAAAGKAKTPVSAKAKTPVATKAKTPASTKAKTPASTKTKSPAVDNAGSPALMKIATPMSKNERKRANKQAREAAQKANDTPVSTSTPANTLKRKALAPLGEQEPEIKKQKVSSSSPLPFRPRLSPIPPHLDRWAGEWLDRTFPVKQEPESEVSTESPVVRVKQEPRDE